MAEFLPDPAEHYKPADNIVSLSGDAWARLYLNGTTLQELAEEGVVEMKRGSLEDASRILALFDEYRPESALLVPPHLHD